MTVDLNLINKDLTDKEFCQILTRPHSKGNRKRRNEEQTSEILANLPLNVTKLNVSGNRDIGAAGMKHLDLLPDTVATLGLCDCGLGPLGIERVCSFMMKSNSSVTKLLLSCNPIRLEGFKAISEMLFQNHTLRDLRMSSCNISVADCGHLSNGLERNTGLRKVALGCSDVLTDDHLKNLCLGLAGNKGLEELDLWTSRSHITEAGVAYLEKILRANNHLRRVHINNFDGQIPTGPGTT